MDQPPHAPGPPARITNIGRLLSGSARNFPDRIAVRDRGSTCTYRALNERVNALAASLQGIATTDDARVLIWLRNCPAYLEVLFACWKSGLVVVPVNARLRGHEVRHLAEDSGATILFYGPEFTAEAAGIDVPYRIVVGGERAAGSTDLLYSQLLEREQPEQARELDEDHPAWLFYTSGTTGRPKGAILTHRNLLHVVLGWCADLYPLEPEDVVLHCAPLSHGAGFLGLAAIARGAENVVHEKWDPARFCADVERFGVTATWLVPTQIRALLDYQGLEARSIASLACIVYGGSPMHREDLVEALRRIGPIFCQIFGQGESPMTITYLRRSEHELDGGPADRLLSAGRPRTGIDVRIVGEDGQPLPDGEVGEIVVRGPTVMSGYWGNPDATQAAIRNGWLHTGDLGRMDECGYLYVLDRKKDFIISGGANVYAREVEDVLLEHPSVHEAAVFGVPHRVWGEAVTAAVVATVTPDELLAFVEPRLADYKRPKQIFLCDELPKNAYGKVLKRDLRATFSESPDPVDAQVGTNGRTGGNE